MTEHHTGVMLNEVKHLGSGERSVRGTEILR
jgi:hypothetical protein